MRKFLGWKRPPHLNYTLVEKSFLLRCIRTHPADWATASGCRRANPSSVRLSRRASGGRGTNWVSPSRAARRLRFWSWRWVTLRYAMRCVVDVYNHISAHRRRRQLRINDNSPNRCYYHRSLRVIELDGMVDGRRGGRCPEMTLYCINTVPKL